MLKDSLKKCENCKLLDCKNCEVNELNIIKNKINEAFELLGGISGGQINLSINQRKLHKAYDKLYRVKKIFEKE